MKSNAQPNMLTRWIAAARQSPQKATLLAALAVVLAIATVRAVLPGADPVRKVAAGLNILSNSQPAPQEDARQRARDLSAQDDLDRFLNGKVAPIDRNVFVVKLEAFKLSSFRSLPSTGTQEDALNLDSAAKLVAEQADQQARKEVLIENLRQQAGQLRLQSTFMGTQPRALINGELLGEGEVIASFRVLKVEPRRVILEREGIKLEILMK